MSEKLLRFLLSELETIRIKCKGKHRTGTDCDFVFEVSSGRLSFMPVECPVCAQNYKLRNGFNSGDGSPFYLLWATLEELRKSGDQFEVEFVLPDKG
jgi:hypothetical protein